jgi:hypothetical protein
MAKRKKFPPIDYSIKEEYRAYFDTATEKVIAVTNVPHHEFKHYAVINAEEFKNFHKGLLKFEDCVIDRFVTPSGQVESRILTKSVSSEFQFDNRSLVWVSRKVDKSTELLITWTPDAWNFHITPAGRDLLTDSLYDRTMVFFATLETDFDFLIRTFYIRVHDLLRKDVMTFPFESKLEKNINSIAITSKKLFNNYGLKIND